MWLQLHNRDWRNYNSIILIIIIDLKINSIVTIYIEKWCNNTSINFIKIHVLTQFIFSFYPSHLIQFVSNETDKVRIKIELIEQNKHIYMKVYIHSEYFLEVLSITNAKAILGNSINVKTLHTMRIKLELHLSC